MRSADSRYVKNPRLQHFYDRSDTGEIVGSTILAPDRRRGRQILRLPVSHKHYSALEEFLQLGVGEPIKSLSADLSELLINTSLLIPIYAISEPVNFDCEVNTTIPDFEDGSIYEDGRDVDLMLNPHITDGVKANHFLVKNIVTGLVTPYRLSGHLCNVYQTLVNHRICPRDICTVDRKVLRNAGILVPCDYLRNQQIERWRQINVAACKYREQGFAIVTKIVLGYYLQSLQRYYKALFDEGFASAGDSLASGRWQIYNECHTCKIHEQLATFVSAIVGQPMKPSYCFTFFYRQKACLPRHVDRENFAVVLSIAIQYSPYKSAGDIWELELSSEQNETSHWHLALEPGDSVLFEGTRLYHERKEFAGEWFTNVLLGYVQESFPGRLGLY